MLPGKSGDSFVRFDLSCCETQPLQLCAILPVKKHQTAWNIIELNIIKLFSCFPTCLLACLIDWLIDWLIGCSQDSVGKRPESQLPMPDIRDSYAFPCANSNSQWFIDVYLRLVVQPHLSIRKVARTIRQAMRESNWKIKIVKWVPSIQRL